MLLSIPQVLSKEQVKRCRQVMGEAEWIDGRSTAGPQSGSVKRNMQLPEGTAAAEQLGSMVLEALSRSPLFIAAAIPMKIFPPLFNRYGIGQHFGTHVDGAIRAVPGGLLFAKIICPSTEASTIQFEEIHFDEKPSTNVIEAAA